MEQTITNIQSYLSPILIGCSIGFLSGFFGMGGALVATPLLNVFAAVPALLALGTPLPAALPSSISGSIQYAKNHHIDWFVVRWTLVSALPLTVLSAWTSFRLTGDILLTATAVVMGYVAITFLVRGWLLKPTKDEEYLLLPKQKQTSLLIGVLTGFLAGLLAIGGGIIMIPAYMKILKMPVKTAFGTSLACIAFLTVPGTIVHAKLGHIDWSIATILGICSIPCSLLGSKIAVRMRSQNLERAYGILMLIFAVYFGIYR